MTSHSVSLRWPVAVLVSMALVAVGAGAGYRLRERTATPSSATETPGAPGPAGGMRMAASGNRPDVVIPVSADAAKRAGIEVSAVTRGAAAGSAVRIPGTIEANAYNQVIVTPLVSGRVTSVMAQLGDQVQRGQTL